jgi:hypothetical protein
MTTKREVLEDFINSAESFVSELKKIRTTCPDINSPLRTDSELHHRAKIFKQSMNFNSGVVIKELEIN